MTRSAVDLNGCRALLTGAGSGYGREIALALAGSGAEICVNDINIERADAVVIQAGECGAHAIALHADVSNRFQAANLIERTRDALGGIDILVNAVEVFHPEALLTIDEWNWRRQLEMNISGAFFCLQLTARVMADEGGGSIINVIAAEALDATISAGIGYLASQSALAAMTRQAARELRSKGIRVNAIAPWRSEESRRRFFQTGSRRDVIGYTHQDAGGAALYLCSDAARSVNGQVIVVA